MNTYTPDKAVEILTNYLDETKRRKTPERYAILDAVYEADGYFSIDEIGVILERRNFRVSRATLYNTIRMFIDLRLVLRHSVQNSTRYEACLQDDNPCRQVCTMCGSVTELYMPEIVRVVENTKLRRFHRDGFALSIYGVCSSCLAKRNRRMGKESKTRNKKQETLK